MYDLVKIENINDKFKLVWLNKFSKFVGFEEKLSILRVRWRPVLFTPRGYLGLSTTGYLTLIHCFSFFYIIIKELLRNT